MHRPLRVLVILALLGTLFTVATLPALAGGGIDVTTTEDEVNVDGDCSLREAIIAANTNSAVDACPAGSTGIDEIALEPTTYTLSIAGAGEDAAATGDLDITGPVNVLTQPIDQRATIDGGGLDRIFDVAADAQVAFFSLELHGGDAGAGEGGAVRIGDGCGSPAGETLAGMSNLVVRDNLAAVGGGIHIGTCRLADAIGLSVIGNQAATTGGGISLLGSAQLRIGNSTISGNAASVAGGGVGAELIDGILITSFTTVADNAALDGAGVWGGLTSSPLLLDTILAGNEGPNCGGIGPSAFSVVSDDPTCGVDPVDDAGIGPLTVVDDDPVHPLEDGSPAIDLNGEPSCASELTFDQVGNPRPQDGDGDGLAWCDAGSIEADAVPVIVPSTPPSPGRSAPPTTPTLPDTAAPAGSGLAGAAALTIGASIVLVAIIRRRREAR